MEIMMLGAARQVGRSAALVKGQETTVLLDFGVLMGRQPSFPIHVSPREVDAILLSHAHLDHTGGAPLFFITNKVGLYATDATIELAELLIKDFLKVSGFYLPYEHLDLMNMLQKSRRVYPREQLTVGEFTATFLEAGHIPGSTSIILEDGRKRVVYTGDVNTIDTQLLKGADSEFGEADLVITESTYATVDHPPRLEVEEEFVRYAREVVERGGTLLVPAFSVGRAQEVACTLRTHRFPYPVAMDGMALEVNEILFRHQEHLRDAALFRHSIEGLEIITSWNQRRRIVKAPSVIISPAGMLVGGASVFYNEKIAQHPKGGIAIVAFQIPGTPGRTLLDRGLTLVNGKPTRVKAEIRRFDFSSHSGRKELLEMMKRIEGSPKVLTVHGEAESCVRFAEDVKENCGFEGVAPKPGESFEV